MCSGPAAGDALRGGSWNNNRDNARCSNRNHNQSQNRNNNVGPPTKIQTAPCRIRLSADLIPIVGRE
jgi:hypothetical protein